MSLEALGRRLARSAARTGEGPARPLWWLAHRVLIGIVARWITAGSAGCRVYLKGGFGFGRPVYGLSDVDAIVIAPGAASRARVERRWESLSERYRTLGQLFQLWTYTGTEIEALEHGSYLTFERGGVLLGPGRPQDLMALAQRPGLYGARRDWRALGRPRRPPPPAGDRPAHETFAWLELRFIWTHAFLLSVDRAGVGAPYTAYKLIADTARIWLWLRFGERSYARERAIARALELMPEDREQVRRALEVKDRSWPAPAAALAQVLPYLVELSARIAGQLELSAAAASATEVRLAWHGPEELLLDEGTAAAAPGARRLVPLADWRARALPGLLDLALADQPGSLEDVDTVAALARASREDYFPVLRRGPLLILPTTEVWARGKLRGIECQSSDPVSLALLAGEEVARFPELPGWSADDCARRAVAEHRGWLSLSDETRAEDLPLWMSPPYHPELVELCGLLGAARAALFCESLAAGAPELTLTAAAVARRLSERDEGARAVAEAAMAELERCRPRRAAPDKATIAALLEVVMSLPAYAP
jgi:hypothetical protein